jgi:chromosome partitioning protein
MKTFLITNPKGGSGKTTLATNLAGYFARNGARVMLEDIDRQGSSYDWLMRRPNYLPIIHRADSRKTPNVDISIIDSPAGLRGEKLSEAVKEADWVIVPMQSSIFDIHATQDFIEVLKAEKAVRKERTFVAIVGMRITENTKAAAKLAAYLAESELPVMGYLRNAQIYMHTAESGLSLFDMPTYKSKRDIEQWSALLKWIKSTEKKPHNK